ncbi:MAG: tRNA (adenosine(37)-N6)-threonylcarbamoyltransferase complex dimerization subunit type 1 TsaB [Chitinophagales bacterium]|jgi:tRNA threonylcarbamoyladenosine biosynthesis protein TsaB|nr:tRNA (adenosine(37)-N6)-threonylcarbamoyltransferase complex dimerization subunit type 1 TsaB [Sphingobacteriales bacterium]MBP6664171.1 tRNA (adenosine(37)-N6)-threonylcarbamoyltransferase complex dimerization subunit type 1 TsaB [Chitinophagales bacterium]MBP7533263.1 tRNA (adenosine(37)-N6)-threonylcarbamoyltransferase complex dimerization subunit type 1 TsaB [Chitinophagales bacterium]
MIQILCIDTTTDVCSVALTQNGTVVAAIENSDKNTQSALLTLYIEQVLKEANCAYNQLSAVAISSGPGSYTGLRIGASVAKGLCYALDIPLISTDTLTALAQQAAKTYPRTNAYYVPMIDARRQEVFAALFDNHLNIINPPQAIVLEPTTFDNLLNEKTVLFCGTGSVKYKSMLQHQNAQFIDTQTVYCIANNIAALSYQQYCKKDFANTAYYEPLYVKPFYIGN